MSFVFAKFLESVIKRTVQAAAAYLAAPAVASTLSQWGIIAEPNAGVVTISLFAVVEALRNYVKHKLDVKWL